MSSNGKKVLKTPVEEVLAAVLLCAMVAMVATHVASRYVLHKSLSHTEELLRYFFVWATFLGVSAATARNRHLAIQGISGIVPKRLLPILSYVKAAAGLAFSAVVFIYGIKVVLLQWQTGQLTAALGMPMWLFGLALPISALFVMYRIVSSPRYDMPENVDHIPDNSRGED